MALKLLSKKKTPAVATKESVTIDFPANGDVIQSNHYTFRIGAGNAANVSVSIDGNDWIPCRESVGYWWYDWATLPGRHQIRAKAETNKGNTIITAARRFLVTLSEFTKN